MIEIDTYSGLPGVDYLHMPLYYSWVQENSYDKTHYKQTGHNFIASYIKRYIDRSHKNINSILETHNDS